MEFKLYYKRNARGSAYVFCIILPISQTHGPRKIIDVRNYVTHRIFNTKWFYYNTCLTL